MEKLAHLGRNAIVANGGEKYKVMLYSSGLK